MVGTMSMTWPRRASALTTRLRPTSWHIPFRTRSFPRDRRPSLASPVPLLEFVHDLIEAEARRLLARRELLETGDPLPDVLLRRHQQVDAVEHPIREVHRL